MTGVEFVGLLNRGSRIQRGIIIINANNLLLSFEISFLMLKANFPIQFDIKPIVINIFPAPSSEIQLLPLTFSSVVCELVPAAFLA